LRSRLSALTGLRFIAASMVFVLHCLPQPGKWIGLDQGVSFFFVLSGFILGHVYPELPDRAAVNRFYIARIARLWPLHLITALLAIGVAGVGSFDTLILNPLLLQGWVPIRRIYFSYNAVSWSLSTEAFFCLAFPLLAQSFHRNWWRKLTGAAAVVAALIAICNWLELPLFSEDLPSAHGVLYIHPLARLFEFVAGMCCCLLWRNCRGRNLGGVWTFTAAECLALALAVALIAFPFPLAHAALGPAGQLWITRTSATPAFCAIVVVFAFGRGFASRLTGNKLFEFLGEISFAFYLVHAAVVAACTRLFGELTVWLPHHYAIAAAAALLAAAALHLFVERPCRAAIVRRTGVLPAGPYTPGAART
jgi:peptidoglycan/LPS O-acetylase OafA/YrhL